MRLRIAAFIISVLAVLSLGGWLIKRRINANEREHAAALERATREPGVLIVDPAIPAGMIEIELIPAGPSIVLPTPATIRVGQETRSWTPRGRARFEEVAGKRDLRVSVIGGDYLVEGASLDSPRGGNGARVALRAIPIDPPTIASPTERRLEISGVDPVDIILSWKQGNIVVSEWKVPRAGSRDALAAEIHKEWMAMGWHRDPSDRRLDIAVVRFEPGSLFYEVFPLVDAILATKRSMTLEGEIRSIPAFDVSVQPAFPSAAPRPDLDVGMRRAPTF